MTLENPSHIIILGSCEVSISLVSHVVIDTRDSNTASLGGAFKGSGDSISSLCLVIPYPQTSPSQALQQNGLSWIACPWTSSAHLALLKAGPNPPLSHSLVASGDGWGHHQDWLILSREIKNSFWSCKSRICSFLGSSVSALRLWNEV